jgi:hypothetical protein
VFRDLVLARVVEPTSTLDAGRVLADRGRKAASDKTMRRTLARCGDRGDRDMIVELCIARVLVGGDVSLVRSPAKMGFPSWSRPSKGTNSVLTGRACS